MPRGPEPDPLFVNRTHELAEFDAVLRGLSEGYRRHIGLLGLRRIGKTLLLDEVRRRHPANAIAYLAVDEVTASPEDFARAFAAEVLTAVCPRGERVGSSDEALAAAARALHPNVEAAVATLLGVLQGGSYGAVLLHTIRLPGVVSEALDRPLLVVLDEFQEIVQLRRFPDTENLLGALRAALDRPGRVGFTVSGSRVTALRALLQDRNGPLFERFTPLELPPFAPEATLDLATRVWRDEDLTTVEPDAVVRLHKLAGGWPFYTRVVAERTAQLARRGDGRITPDLVDLSFQQEVIGRAATIGLHCRYLLDTALALPNTALRNTVDAVLRAVAAQPAPVARANLVRRLQATYPRTTVYDATRALIDADFLREEGGLLELADPVFALWLVVEPERRDPDAAFRNPRALQRRMQWYEGRHAQDREEMGTLFERRVENLVRQFRGQLVDGRLFGQAGQCQLPVVRAAGRVVVPDSEGRYGPGPDTYELDIVTMGDGPADVWAVEAKHRQGALTRRMVERFLENVRGVAANEGLTFAQRWIVAPRGIRPDAEALARREGLLVSGLRQLRHLERLGQRVFEAALLADRRHGAGPR